MYCEKNKNNFDYFMSNKPFDIDTKNLLKEINNLENCIDLFRLPGIKFQKNIFLFIKDIMKFLYIKIIFILLKPLINRQLVLSVSIKNSLIYIYDNQKKLSRNLAQFYKDFESNYRVLNDLMIKINKDVSELKLYLKLCKDIEK